MTEVGEHKTYRVLIVEDEPLVAMLVEDMLIEMGHVPVGPAMRLSSAMAMASDEIVDLAVLDVNLADEQSFPVAYALQKRGIPFMFATGYGLAGLDGLFAGVVTLQKPFGADQLQDAIFRALA